MDDLINCENSASDCVNDCEEYCTMVDHEGNEVEGITHKHKNAGDGVCEPIPCKNNRIFMSDIMKNLNCANKHANNMRDCCDEVKKLGELRFLRVKDFLFVTSDGSKPSPVALPKPIPDTHTWMNHVEMETIVFNHKEINAMWMDGVLVFYGIYELRLPQYKDTFNLATFIEKALRKLNKFGSAQFIRVHNDHIQPSMISGNLNQRHHVELINHSNAAITGTNPSSDAMTLTTPLELFNQGWIKGAGGNGNVGKQGAKGPDSKRKYWKFIEEVYDGTERPILDNETHCPGFRPMGVPARTGWHEGFDEQVFWHGTWQGHMPKGTDHLDIKGTNERWYKGKDQHQPLRRGECGSWWKLFSLIKKKYVNETVHGGAGGSAGKGGIGQSFKTKRTNGTAGGAGHHPGGHNGTKGGDGGTWGKSGNPGAHPGHAITGIANLVNRVANGYGNIIGGVR